MNFHFKAHCPRCGTKNAAFTALSASSIFTPNLIDVFSICGICDRGAIATYSNAGAFSHSDFRSLKNCQLKSISPSPPSRKAPKYTPDNIASFYVQGLASLFTRHYDAAGSMFRKTLDTGLKNSFPAIQGSLSTRIKTAAKEHQLTPSLADLADHIRLEGNKAVHEEEPFSAEEAEDLQAFTELVLSYLYFLPGKLEEAQHKIAVRSKQMTDHKPRDAKTKG